MLLVLVDNVFTTSSFNPERQNLIKFSHILSNFNAVLCQEYVISFVKSVFSLMINSNTELIHFRVIGNNPSSGAQWNATRK